MAEHTQEDFQAMTGVAATMTVLLIISEVLGLSQKSIHSISQVWKIFQKEPAVCPRCGGDNSLKEDSST
jgi:hypothetical protein